MKTQMLKTVVVICCTLALAVESSGLAKASLPHSLLVSSSVLIVDVLIFSMS